MTNNRVMLAILPRIQDDFGYTPAGASQIKGSLIEAGYECKVMDLNREVDILYKGNLDILVPLENWFMNYNFYSKKIYKLVNMLMDKWSDDILAWNPTYVGMSVFSYNNQRATRLLAIYLKSKNPKINILIGGGGINTDFTFSETLLKEKIINGYIRGEGELATVEYLKGNFDAPGINGNPRKQIDDIDSLAYPDYSDYELQNYTNKKGLIAIPITGSRGCVRACTFCDIASMWPAYRFRSGKSIAKEMKYQIETAGATAFRFTDSLTNGSMKAFREMTSELTEYRKELPEHKKFIWDGHFIVRSKKQMVPQDFVSMAQSGAGTLWLGIESGSHKVRTDMKKGYTDEDLHYSLMEIFKNNVKVRFLIIIGYPTETQEDFQQTLDFFEKYAEYGRNGLVEEVNLGLTLNLLPNTPLYDNAKEYGLETTKEHINDWICVHNPTLDFKERLRRRIQAHYHVEKLGYKVYETKNYTRALNIAWTEVVGLNKSKLNRTVGEISTFIESSYEH